MAGQSVYLGNALLGTMRGVPYSTGTIFLSLHTANPGATGASEVATGSYQRVGVTFAAPGTGTMAMVGTAAVTVPAGTTVSYAGLWDATSGGNFLIGGPLTTPITFSTSGTLNLTSLTLNETL